MPLETVDLVTPPAQPTIEEQRVQLAARWTLRSMNPRLAEIDERLEKALHLAKLDLGVAIMEMDRANEDPDGHSVAMKMITGMAVERAIEAHAQALANYVRGEEPDDEDDS